jgi:hypothetical protein
MPGTPIGAVADIEGGLLKGALGRAFLFRVSNSSLGIFARTNEENE